MHIFKTCQYLVIGMLVSAASVPLAADAGACFTLTPKPIVQLAGPLYCSCTPIDPLSIGLGTQLGKITIGRPNNPLGGGPVNCYQSTVIAECFNTVSGGGALTVTPMFVKSRIVQRKCDLSGCGSIFFGLVKWGGGECVEDSSSQGAPVQSWKATGTCDDPDVRA